MAALHVGSRSPETVIDLLPNDTEAFVELDTWEEWGESNAEDRQYHGVHHIIIRAPGKDSAALLADLSWIISEGAPLEPMRGPEHQAWVLAVMTSETDWWETYLIVNEGNVPSHGETVAR